MSLRCLMEILHRDYLVIIGFIEVSIRAVVSTVSQIQAPGSNPGKASMIAAVHNVIKNEIEVSLLGDQTIWKTYRILESCKFKDEIALLDYLINLLPLFLSWGTVHLMPFLITLSSLFEMTWSIRPLYFPQENFPCSNKFIIGKYFVFAKSFFFNFMHFSYFSLCFTYHSFLYLIYNPHLK